MFKKTFDFLRSSTSLSEAPRGSKAQRVCCIGLDGTPHSLLQRMLADGTMPNLAALVREGRLHRMTSVYPWVSSVAWTTLQTGVNPAKHGIYGFVDRDPATLKIHIPLASRIKRPAVWDRLGQAGKRVIVLNVPVTYPAGPVNGILVAGFLAPKLNEKAVSPVSMLPTLERLGYRIDTNPQIARQDRDKALEDIHDALDKRTRTFLHLLDHQPWEFFLGVIMETDRLHHFFFEPMEQGHPVYMPAFFEVYRRIDEFLGQVRERLGAHDMLMMMSDHGFCSIRQEVFYNHWLAEAGYLKYVATPAKTLEQLHPDSVAYSLDPGRIFINLKGRERTGRIAPGAEYERVRDEIIAAAEALTAPGTGERMVRKAYRREELYSGPYLEQAADIILAPEDGYDPKGAFYKESLVHKDAMMVGMHTYDDAFFYIGGTGAAKEPVSILDVAPTVLRLMGQSIPDDYDGRSLDGPTG
ncbi:MAG: alkaline phosphatase family protein [Ardenticatenaceae bacterium]|nr:alkaline phosphatase family protein [Ardenticatenaceae bacterium]